MKLYGVILLVFLCCTSPAERYTDNSLNKSSLNSPENEDHLKVDSSLTNILTYKIIASADGTFGYDIYTNNKIFIHQPHRPTLPGTKGFGKREDAEKIARLVIKKIQAGEALPAISIKEMKQLGIIK